MHLNSLEKGANLPNFLKIKMPESPIIKS